MDELIIEPGRKLKETTGATFGVSANSCTSSHTVTFSSVTNRRRSASPGQSLGPALTMVIFVAFRRITKLPAAGVVPDAILVYAALLPWQLFSTALTEGVQ